MNATVIKFSSENCGICHKMSFYDEKVARELGLDFIDVKMQDTATYRKYRKILLAQYPDKTGMGWPTYIVCEQPEGDFKILGEIKGGHPKGEFRQLLEEIIAQNAK
ncbi:MAG: thioredoxin family protein [Cyanobacteria bacterium J083]|nr:MAG: thioredoxin family protein [Cyanobacteria bacterium J083]